MPKNDFLNTLARENPLIFLIFCFFGSTGIASTLATSIGFQTQGAYATKEYVDQKISTLTSQNKCNSAEIKSIIYEDQLFRLEDDIKAAPENSHIQRQIKKIEDDKRLNELVTIKEGCKI